MTIASLCVEFDTGTDMTRRFRSTALVRLVPDVLTSSCGLAQYRLCAITTSGVSLEEMPRSPFCVL